MKSWSKDLDHSLMRQICLGANVFAGMIDASVAQHRTWQAFKVGGFIGGAIGAAFFMMATPAKAGEAHAAVPGTQITVSSVQGADFAALSQNKILLVASPDFFKLAIKLFQKENLPNSGVVIAADMPSKKAAIFVNGQKFEFQDTTDNTFISDFEHQKLAAVMARLKTHLEERPKANLEVIQPGQS